MYGNDFGGKYPVLLPTITGWPSYWGSCRWDDFLILTGYIKNTEVLRCPSANQYLELLFYDVPAPFDGTKAAVYSIRHYGMPVFGIGGGTSAGPFALVNVNVSTIRNAAERVALGDSDPGFYPLYHSVDAAAWGYGHLNTWMLDGDDGSSWHGVSAIRHAKGGNYLYLDGHVSFGAHSEVNFDQSPGKWASWWYHPQAPAIP
jgi:prepilin-type processing-associated H-X9-DG protein